eukprot:TRINITY_DN11701_c0_g1_i1.p1 TRINITY_DN11701_c0_g1~~TRINITY_DN11701_c0_g1_i1.p1  ORF type:complete len:631 (+),score=179.61 TRINITY_DN11701_c0_g1_i1:127-2019(+)
MWVDDRGKRAPDGPADDPPPHPAAPNALTALPLMNGRGSRSLPPEPDCKAPVPTEPAPDALTCPLCLELYEVPCVLPCGHTVCRGCVMALGGEGSGLLCPTCKTPSGPVNPSQLPVNVGIERALASLHAQGRGAGPQTCDKCEEAVATLACDACNLLLCEACNEEHHKGKFKFHQISDASTFSSTMVPFCRRAGHSRYKTDLLCLETGELVCLLCFQIDRDLKDKTCIPVGEAMGTTKDEVVAWVERAELCKADMKNSVVHVDKATGHVRDAYTEDLHRVRAEFRALRSDLEAREMQAVEALARNKDRQAKALGEVRHKIASGIAGLNVEIVRAEHAVKSGTVTDLCQLLGRNKTLLQRLDAGGGAAAKLPPCPRPVVRINKAAANAVKNLVVVETDGGVMDTPRNSVQSSVESPRSAATPSPLSSSNAHPTRHPVRLTNSLYAHRAPHHAAHPSNGSIHSRDLHSEESDNAVTPPVLTNGGSSIPSHRRSTTASREAVVHPRVGGAFRPKQPPQQPSAATRSKSRGQSPPNGRAIRNTNGAHTATHLRNGYTSPQHPRDRSLSPVGSLSKKELVVRTVKTSPADTGREANHAYVQPAVYTRQFQQRQEVKSRAQQKEQQVLELREGWKR